MKIERVELHLIDMPLAHAFETSFGREETRPCIFSTAGFRAIFSRPHTGTTRG